jgi:hypothetical protein
MSRAFRRALDGRYDIRHTIISINGFMGDPYAMMPADTARALGEDVNWIPLFYNSSAFPLGVGVKDGYAVGVQTIRNIPGTFILDAYSEGTIIAKMLEDALLTGELSDRNDDWIASVKWGDACRELHHWYGDPKDPGGAGISGPDNTVNTDPRIHSYVYPWNEGDVYANCPNNATGKRMTLVYQLVIERWNGELKSLIEEAEELIKEPVANVISIVSAVFKYFGFIGSGQVAHMDYPIDDAVAYLRQRMAEVPARIPA